MVEFMKTYKLCWAHECEPPHAISHRVKVEELAEQFAALRAIHWQRRRIAARLFVGVCR